MDINKNNLGEESNAATENATSSQASQKLSAMARIMQKRIATKHIAEEQVEAVTLEVNKSNFFIDDNPKDGFVTKAVFLDLFTNVLMQFEIQGFILFLEHASRRTKLSIPPITKPWHHTKREYFNVWPESKTVESKFSLVKFPFTEKLVMYYTFDMAKINLSFDELYDYAESSI